MRITVLVCILLAATFVSTQQHYDIVVKGGRVLDPETGLEAVRNVAIDAGKIVRISSETVQGERVINARGLVVAPGFIDLHQHGQDLDSQRLKALDGVTTALEMEISAADVNTILKSKEGRSLNRSARRRGECDRFGKI